jgi:hypothetical protein
MRDANEREEQFRKRVQPITSTDTPKESQPSLSTVSSASSLSFHTPAVDQSPNVFPVIESKQSAVTSPSTIEEINNEDTRDLISVTPKMEIQSVSKQLIRHTATEETTQAEYRSTVKLVPSTVLKSTIQYYMMDHNPFDDSQGK